MVVGLKAKICSAFTITLLFFSYNVVLQEIAEVKDVRNDTSAAETLFKRLYKLERIEQLAAVKALLKLDKPERKKKMLEAIATKVLYVIEGSKLILEDEQFIPGETAFPGDERVRDALANVLENTAFLADIIIRLPNMSQKVISQKSEWMTLLQWSINFTNQSKLIDSKTIKLLDLVNQEMNYTQKTIDFSNPYNKEIVVPEPEEPPKKKKIRKKKVIPKGPRLSRQAGEL